MRQFTFTYETLRQSKIVAEKLIKKEIAHHYHHINHLEQTEKHLKNELERLIQQRSQSLNLGSSALILQQFQSSYYRLTEENKAAVSEINDLKESIKESEVKLLVLMKEIKELDKIEQQQYEEYTKELKNHQDKETDEIIGYRSSRQLQGVMV